MAHAKIQTQTHNQGSTKFTAMKIMSWTVKSGLQPLSWEGRAASGGCCPVPSSEVNATHQ